MGETQPIPATLAAAGRYAVTTGVAYAVGHGWLDSSNAAQAVAVGIAVLTFAYGVLKTHQRQTKIAGQ
jgi:hypothetical protein